MSKKRKETWLKREAKRNERKVIIPNNEDLSIEEMAKRMGIKLK